jgi:hypothetical protein
MNADWLYSGGTLSLEADYRTVSIKSSVDVIDGTAGSDTTKVKYLGMTDITVDMTQVLQTGGTLNMTQLTTGTQGTLIIQPEGTATGKTKFTIPAFVTSSYDYPYNDIATCSLTFNGMGAFTITVN